MFHGPVTYQDETAHRAAFVADDFDRSRGPYAAYLASHALCALGRHAGNRGAPITPEQAHRVAPAIGAARPHILALFPDRFDRACAARSLGAAEGLALEWAVAPKGATLEGTPPGANARQHTRWLQNACHNLVLRDEIERTHAANASDARRARLFNGTGTVPEARPSRP